MTNKRRRNFRNNILCIWVGTANVKSIDGIRVYLSKCSSVSQRNLTPRCRSENEIKKASIYFQLGGLENFSHSVEYECDKIYRAAAKRRTFELASGSSPQSSFVIIGNNYSLFAARPPPSRRHTRECLQTSDYVV